MVLDSASSPLLSGSEYGRTMALKLEWARTRAVWQVEPVIGMTVSLLLCVCVAQCLIVFLCRV